MSIPLVYALFFALTVALFALAFLPGLLEIRRRRDVQPLSVSADSRVDVRHLANGFRGLLPQRFAPLLRSAQETGKPLSGRLGNVEPFTIMPGGYAMTLAPQEESARRCDRILLSMADLHPMTAATYTRELYAAGAFMGAAKSRYRAVLAEGDVNLGPDSSVMRWIHAGRELHVGPRCHLHGRASADVALTVLGDCRFDRLNAPLIRFGEVLATAAPAPQGATAPSPQGDTAPHGAEPTAPGAALLDASSLRPLHPQKLRHLADFSVGRALVRGDLKIPPGSLVDFDLVVIGELVVGAGSLCRRSLKGRHNVVLEAGVQVEGSVVSERNLIVREGCVIHGPALAERHLKLARGCVVGTPQRPTTLRAETLEIQLGSVLHGSAWAGKGGVVTS
jgi:hypothetical protein